MFVKLTPRQYQLAIFNSVMQNGNTLVVLPTGLGKTLIAVMLIKEMMSKGRCLLLTPTKPLARQHSKSIAEVLELPESQITLVTGEMQPAKRTAEYSKPIIISTPQTIRNDLEYGRIQGDFALVIYDECHRTIGDYAYTQIAQNTKGALFVGLTASPGGKKERIREVLDNLFITNIEVRTHEDPDVAQYVQKSDFKWIPVDLTPQLRSIKVELDEMAGRYAQKLTEMGFPPPIKHKGRFMELRKRILAINHPMKYPLIIQYSVLLHILHMLELLETQGIYPLRKYIEKLKEKESKSANLLLHEPGLHKIVKLCEGETDHPKLLKLVEIISELKGQKLIVFAQYRDQIKKIVEVLETAGFRAKQFVGKKDGVTRKIQEQTIDDFRSEKFDIMVCSSIGEEGLDIPAVDSVIFYEPIPSEIRSIQRRGRAARLKKGSVYVLMTRGTRDEYYFHASYRKEKQMKAILKKMSEQISGKPVHSGVGITDKKSVTGKKPVKKEMSSGSDDNLIARAQKTHPAIPSKGSKSKPEQTKMSDFL